MDGALFVPNRDLPTIFTEVGYSETWEDLTDDARLLLEGSRGRGRGTYRGGGYGRGRGNGRGGYRGQYNNYPYNANNNHRRVEFCNFCSYSNHPTRHCAFLQSAQARGIVFQSGNGKWYYTPEHSARQYQRHLSSIHNGYQPNRSILPAQQANVANTTPQPPRVTDMHGFDIPDYNAEYLPQDRDFDPHTVAHANVVTAGEPTNANIQSPSSP